MPRSEWVSVFESLTAARAHLKMARAEDPKWRLYRVLSGDLTVYVVEIGKLAALGTAGPRFGLTAEIASGSGPEYDRALREANKRNKTTASVFKVYKIADTYVADRDPKHAVGMVAEDFGLAAEQLDRGYTREAMRRDKK